LQRWSLFVDQVQAPIQRLIVDSAADLVDVAARRLMPVVKAERSMV